MAGTTLNAQDSLSAGPAEAEVFITRIINAPRAAVFAAWSDAEQLKQWFAPTGCALSHCSIDFRAGGALHHCIDTPGGACWCKGEYLEIIAPERIVYTLRFSDADGNEVDSSPVGKDSDWPMQTTVTVTLDEHEGKTRLSLHQTVSEAVARRTGAYPSWLGMLDRLDVLLAA